MVGTLWSHSGSLSHVYQEAVRLDSLILIRIFGNMDSCPLPLEICIHIIRQLAEAGERGHLNTSSLVCHAWRDFVQPFIFGMNSICVDSRRISATKWAERLAISPHIGNIISRVRLRGYPDPAIDLLASRLRKITSLELPQDGLLPTGPPNLLYRVQKLVIPIGPNPTRLISLLTSMPNLHDLSLSLSSIRWHKYTGKSVEEWQLANRMLLQGETKHLRLGRLSLSSEDALYLYVEHLLDFLLLPQSFDFQHLRTLVIHWKWMLFPPVRDFPESMKTKFVHLGRLAGKNLEHLVINHDDWYNHVEGAKLDALANSGFMLCFPSVQRLELTVFENKSLENLIAVDGLASSVYLEPLRRDNQLRIVDINLVFEKRPNVSRTSELEGKWSFLDALLSDKTGFPCLEQVNIIVAQGKERDAKDFMGERGAHVSLVHEKLPRLSRSSRLVVSHVFPMQ